MEIPTITEKKLEELLRVIKPVDEYDTSSRIEKILRWAFPWLSQEKNESLYFTDYSEGELFGQKGPRATELDPIPYRTIDTRHTYRAQMNYRRSFAEVFAQIPLDVIKETVAFEMILPLSGLIVPVDDLSFEEFEGGAAQFPGKVHLYKLRNSK